MPHNAFTAPEGNVIRPKHSDMQCLREPLALYASARPVVRMSCCICPQLCCEVRADALASGLSGAATLMPTRSFSPPRQLPDLPPAAYSILAAQHQQQQQHQQPNAVSMAGPELIQ